MVAAASTTSTGTGPSAELRQIALFIAKWKLEATKTKLLLARLTPPRRRWVMANFAQSGTAVAPTAQLEQYIAKCERENLWAGASSATPAVASKPVSGLKRPLTPSAVTTDPNKRSQPAWLSGSSAVSGLRPAAAK